MTNQQYRKNSLVMTSKQISHCNGSVPSARCFYSCISYMDKIYIFGGLLADRILTPSFGDDKISLLVSDDFYEFDINQRKWSKIEADNSPQKRYGHSAIVYEGKLWIFGGRNKYCSFLNDVYVFDFETKQWQVVWPSGEETIPRCKHAACVWNDKMIIVGGVTWIGICNGLHFFDLKKKRWENTFKTSGNELAVYAHDVCIVNDELYIIGGITGWMKGGYHLLSSVDLKTMSYRNYSVKPSHVYLLVATSFEKRVYVAGNLFQVDSTILAYWDHSSWRVKCRIPNNFMIHSLVEKNDQMLMFGGTCVFTNFNKIISIDMLCDMRKLMLQTLHHCKFIDALIM